MPLIIPTRFYQPRGAFDPAAAAGYQGPVDAVAGATHYWGLRAVTLASIGANAVELRESGGNTLQTFATIAGGGLDLAAIATFKGANNLFVRRIYDQIGTDHMIQASNSVQPPFILNIAAGGTLPVLQILTGGQYLETTLAGGAISQPYTLSAVARRTTGTADSYIMGGGSTGVQFATTSGRISTFSGSGAFVDGNTENVFHSINIAYNGASSDMNIDGTSNSKSPGTGTVGATIGFLAQSGQGSATNTEMVEHIIYSSALSSANLTALDVNQSAYWAY